MLTLRSSYATRVTSMAEGATQPHPRIPASPTSNIQEISGTLPGDSLIQSSKTDDKRRGVFSVAVTLSRLRFGAPAVGCN